MDMPPHARAGRNGRGHRFAAYPRCSAGQMSGHSIRNRGGVSVCWPRGLGRARCSNRLSNAALARRSFRGSGLRSPTRRSFPRATAHSLYGPSIPQADHSFPSAPSIPGHATFVGIALRQGVVGRGSIEGSLFGATLPFAGRAAAAHNPYRQTPEWREAWLRGDRGCRTSGCS
jgi:hypothetical protein